MFIPIASTVLLLLELAAPTAAAIAHRPSLEIATDEKSAHNEGAHFDSEPVEGPEKLPFRTYFGEHSVLVMNDMFIFHNDIIGINPNLKDKQPRNEAAVFTFIPVGNMEDSVEEQREQARQLLYRAPIPTTGSLAAALLMFGANSLIVAHAPRDLRVVLDGPIHFGPATFDAGGMGMALGGHAPWNIRAWEPPNESPEEVGTEVEPRIEISRQAALNPFVPTVVPIVETPVPPRPAAHVTRNKPRHKTHQINP